MDWRAVLLLAAGNLWVAGGLVSVERLEQRKAALELAKICEAHGGAVVGSGALCEHPSCGQCRQEHGSGFLTGSFYPNTCPSWCKFGARSASGRSGAPEEGSKGAGSTPSADSDVAARAARLAALSLWGSRAGAPPHAPCALPPPQCLAGRGRLDWVVGGPAGSGRGPPFVAMYRLLGNDMVPLQSPGQIRTNGKHTRRERNKNLRVIFTFQMFFFIFASSFSIDGSRFLLLFFCGVSAQYALEHELLPPPGFGGAGDGGGGVETVWVLNKLVNASEEAAIVEALQQSHLRRSRAASGSRDDSVDSDNSPKGPPGSGGLESGLAGALRGLPVAGGDRRVLRVARLGLDPACLAHLPRARRVPFAMGLNEARNAMLAHAAVSGQCPPPPSPLPTP